MKTKVSIIKSIEEDEEKIKEALKIKKLYNQLVLTSEKALTFLNFIGTVPEEKL